MNTNIAITNSGSIIATIGAAFSCASSWYSPAKSQGITSCTGDAVSVVCSVSVTVTSCSGNDSVLIVSSIIISMFNGEEYSSL